jgi:phage shock protein C
MYDANQSRYDQGRYNDRPAFRRLERQDGILGGVCGGLGAFFGITPWLFRIIFLFLAMPGGLPGVLPYLILWLVIPKRRD